MTPNEIAVKAKALKTKQDLFDLINKIRATEGPAKHKALRSKEFACYCNPDSKRVKRYRVFYIPKKSGGKREICAPSSKLEAYLWPVDLILKSLYEPKSCVMGFTYGRSIVDNAKAHLGQNYILNLDLKDFFPSIKQARVWKRLQLAPFNFPKDVASAMAGLCSIKKEHVDGTKEYILPQGAPTSPVLTNIVCERLDHRLLGVAKRFNLRYTRYADDMTFSSMHSVLNIGGDAYDEIIRVIEEQGFTVNQEKTRLQKVGARQEVTGLILSEKVNTPRSYVRDLNQILYVWEKFGYEKAYARLLLEDSKKTYHKKGVPTLENVISGKLDYLKMVKGAKDKVYIKYASKFDNLKKQKKRTSEGLVYMATYSVADFQSLFHTELQTTEISGKFRAFFKLHDVFYPVRITTASRNAISKKSKEIGSLYISLCQDKNLFWLIHINKPTEPKILEITLPVKKIIEIWEKKGLAAAIEVESKNKASQTKKKTARKSPLSLFEVLSDSAEEKTAIGAGEMLRIFASSMGISEAMRESIIENAISDVPSDSYDSHRTDIEEFLNKKSKDGEQSGDN